MATYTVVRGDCLWNIAKAKLGSGTRWKEIANLNNISISNPIIYAGQVLQLPGSSTTTTTTNTSNKAVIDFFGLLAGEDRTLFVAWSWDKSKTEKYQIQWKYDTENVKGIIASSSNSVDDDDPEAAKQTTYTIPENAVIVYFKVKPVAEKETVNDKETTPWTASWSTVKTYNTKYLPLPTPSSPTVTIDKTINTIAYCHLTVRLDNIEINEDAVLNVMHLEIVRDDIKVIKSLMVQVQTASASYECFVNDGSSYKARVRIKSSLNPVWSDWSAYSGVVYAPPLCPTNLTVKAKSENDVYLSWNAVEYVTGYEYQYTTNRDYFDTAPDQVTSVTMDGSNMTSADVLDLETGNFAYFFRVRSKGEGGESEWSESVGIILGKEPAAPTTWSSTASVVVGSPVTLYWVHNSEDGSSQTYAQLELNVNGTVTTETIKNTTDEEERDNTSYYTLDTSGYSEGANILWRVRTAGVLTESFGEWSVQRTIDIHAQPTMVLLVSQTLDGDAFDTLESFPIYVEASAGPDTQLPLSYYLSIVSNEDYETVDNLGNPVVIRAGEAVYSRYFDNNFDILGVADTSLYVELTPSVVNLENNISYKLTCTAAMNSGLKAEESVEFTVAWEDVLYSPNAEIGYDPDTYSTFINPYCRDENGDLISGILLSVYRREFDGTFTELMTEIPNNGTTFISDPHPALDYARYRIVAMTESTGAIQYYDMPGYVIGESAAIIQWDEEWSSFEGLTEEETEDRAWTGSLLRLPYNIDISTSNTPDVSLVEYIGRKYPVSYYGTQIGETMSVKTDVPADDIETLYTLRRLKLWGGDVYIRLPNGVGYWANITIQYNENHLEVKVPVTVSVTRVEGGV